jgi:FlgD Ig-like domain
MFLSKPWRRAVRTGALSIMIIALCSLVPTVSQAQLSPYSQNFEGMVLTDPTALSNDGWLVYGNVFSPAMVYLYGYGPYPAPNIGPPHFCILVTGEGSPTQGLIQLSVFSDYENADHANGNLIESNVYREQTIDAGDVGQTWYFEFDAKRGNIGGASTALAFIKTLDPGNGYATTNFIHTDMTAIPITWNRYSLSITIDAGLVGQILQIGFSNTAANYEPSGIFYDNLDFTQTSTVDVQPVMAAGQGIQLSTRGNPVIGQAAQVLAFSLPRNDHVTVRVYDVSGALVTTLMDRELTAGAHQVIWRGDDATGRSVASGVYVAEVVAGGQHAVAKLNRLR